MPRYIDADALRQRMYHEAFETDTNMQRWDSGCWIRYKLFENCLESMPTVSADEVRGVGEWMPDFDLVHCSVCGAEELARGKSNYCPNCGARMKGAEDD